MSNDALVSAFRIPASLSSLAFVRGAVALIIDREFCGGESAGRMLLAASEAVSNAIEHGSPPDGGGEVEVRIAITDTGATLVVTDQGRPGVRPSIDVDAPTPHPASTRGRGIVIMRNLSDDLRVEPAGAGTRVTMDFRIARVGARGAHGDGRVAAAA
ncbi:MAG: ATP-binding protein [Thermoleophilia bacterium]|nr:ATP-binding protein [Thermoleophilia bacterium]